MKVIVISASPRKNANTQLIMKHVFEYTESKDVDVKFINLSEGQIECYRGPEEEYNEATKNATRDIMDADVEGKVAGMAIIAAGNIGFIDVQTLITQLLSYFRVIANPKAVFLTVDSISNNVLSDESAKEKLNEMVDGTIEMATKLQN
jgi:NAD(P)H-dependent FMN reductase